MPLVSQSKAAKLAGTSSQAVSQASRNLGPLSDARVGTKIDTEHPRWIAWASRFDPDETRGRGRPPNPDKPVGDDTEELKRLKLIEEVREKRLKNAELERSVISREFVTTHLFGMLEELSRRLLADAARTIARDSYIAAKSGVSIEETEGAIRDILSKNLKKARDGARRKIRGLDRE